MLDLFFHTVILYIMKGIRQQLLILSLEQLMISKRNVSALGPKTHVASILIQSITVLYSQAINKLFIFMF